MSVEQVVYDRRQASWGSIIAGVFTTMAVSLVMAVLGIAFGFTVIEPTSSEPFSGLGMTFGIWSVVSILLSLIAGGFIAGFFSPGKGAEHGFLVWAVVLLVASFFSTLAVGSAMHMVGSAVKTVGSGAATVASGAASGIGGMVSGAVDAIQENVDLNLNSEDLGNDIRTTLRNTGIETLQPEYLSQQMREARSDLRQAIHQLRLNSDNYEQIITNFLDRQQQRLQNITQDIDREDAITAVMNNSNMTRSEAEEAVDSALAAYQNVVSTAQDAIYDARQQFQDAQVYMAELAERTRVRAEEVSNSAARAGFMAAIALIVGAVASSIAGGFGARFAVRRYTIM